MSLSIRVLRGVAASIPSLADGEFYFATDTKNLYMGLSGVNYVIGGTSLPPSGAAGGDLTGTYPNPAIGANKVTLAQLAQIATDSILGRAAATTGDVEVLTALPFAFTGDVTRPADSNVTTLANYATQAQQEAATSAVTVVNPAVQQFHPSAVKGYCRFNGTTTPAGIDQSYNVTSLTDSGAGSYAVVWDVNFSAATKNCSVASAGSAGDRYLCDLVATGSVVAGSTAVVTYARGSSTLVDVSYVGVLACGDQ